MSETRTCPDCGRQFTSAEMAAEARAYYESCIAAVAEQMRTDAAFGRMTGADERTMDLLDVTVMELERPPKADASDSWTSEQCWRCKLEAAAER